MSWKKRSLHKSNDVINMLSFYHLARRSFDSHRHICLHPSYSIKEYKNGSVVNGYIPICFSFSSGVMDLVRDNSNLYKRGGCQEPEKVSRNVANVICQFRHISGAESARHRNISQLRHQKIVYELFRYPVIKNPLSCCLHSMGLIL